MKNFYKLNYKFKYYISVNIKNEYNKNINLIKELLSKQFLVITKQKSD